MVDRQIAIWIKLPKVLQALLTLEEYQRELAEARANQRSGPGSQRRANEETWAENSLEGAKRDLMKLLDGSKSDPQLELL